MQRHPCGLHGGSPIQLRGAHHLSLIRTGSYSDGKGI